MKPDPDGAARYYFNASARELSLGQALYISSIMPNPKLQHFGAGGAVTPTWMSYLRKLMQVARTGAPDMRAAFVKVTGAVRC